MGKIKEAYGDSRDYVAKKLAASGMKDKAKIEAESREATIRAVQKTARIASRRSCLR